MHIGELASNFEIKVDYTPKRDYASIEDTRLAEDRIRYLVDKYMYENYAKIFSFVDYPYKYENFLFFKEILVNFYAEEWAKEHYKFLN